MKKFIFIIFLASCFAFSSAKAQKKTVTGIVKGADDNLPLPGVSVIIKGTTVGVSTDVDGKFTLTASEGNVLLFSFVGMEQKEIVIGKQNNLTIFLKIASLNVEEVVVTGYGTQKKSDFTGSVGMVTSEKIANLAVANPVRALEGATAGVQVLSGSGQPGSAPTIRIRGIASINASKNPLYVVDGIIYNGNIANISSNDIASMNVLKDAAATALYGSRGGNGVIVITTKKGKTGKAKIEFRSSIGFSERAIPEYDKLDAAKYYELSMEAYVKGMAVAYEISTDLANNIAMGNIPAYNNLNMINNYLGTNMYNKPIYELFTAYDDGTYSLNKDAKPLYNGNGWEDEMYRTGIRQDYSIAISGGSETTNYYISLNRLEEQGILEDSDYERNSIRVNLDSKLREWFKIGANIMITQGKSSFTKQTAGAAEAVFSWMRNIAPIYPMYVRDDKGKLVYDNSGNKIVDYGNGVQDGITGQANNVRKFNQGSSILSRKLDPEQTKRNAFLGNFFAELSPIKDIKIRLEYNKYISNYNQLDYTNMIYGWGRLNGGSASRLFYTGDTESFKQFITFDKKMNLNSFNISLIHENYENEYENMDNYKTGFPIPTLRENTAAAVLVSSDSGQEIYRTEAYLFKGDYNYDNKYYAKFSFRRDASSRFYKNNRWSNFWAISGAWRVSSESFMESLDFINNLRLKASYGTNGNDNIGGNYPYQAQYTTGRNNTDMPGLRLNSFDNYKLLWEKQKKLNVGFDITLFDSLIDFEVDYFRTNTEDMLFSEPIPRSSGLSTIDKNIGSMLNSGLEYVLLLHPLKGDFKWDISLNLTHYKNEVTKLSRDLIRNGNQAYKEGKSAYEFYMYESAGIDPETGNLLWWMNKKDENGKVIGREKTDNANLADEYWLGTSLPDFYGGITNTLSYKGLTFTANITYSVGGQLIDHEYAALMGRSSGGFAWHKDIINRWTKKGQKTDVPSLIWNSSQTEIQNEDRYMTDASYLNISNLSLSYTLPEDLTKKIGLERVSFNTSVSNLKLFTKRKGLNSAASISGTSGGDVYSPLRTVSFGTIINF